MIYAVDIDGTLCKEEHRWWEYDKAPPIQDAINKVNILFGKGYHIIIYTARPEKDRLVTYTWLEKHKVRYHELVMDKPRADVYLDNSAKRMDEI